VADRPYRGPLRVGQLVTFHPPGDYTETYTHEVYRVLPGGQAETRGLADGSPDPWRISASDIVGTVAFTIWGLGWLLECLPFLAVGVACWVLVRPLLSRRSRLGWDQLWTTIVAITPLWLQRPLVGASIISSAPGGNDAHQEYDVVNTGLLPASLRFPGGRPHYLPPGGTKWLAARGGDHMVVHEVAALAWWGWAVVALVVVSPLIAYFWSLARAKRPEPRARAAARTGKARRPGLQLHAVGLERPVTLR
jgi:hypothetical protein